MGARFRVNRIFRLSDRPGFFAAGDVLDGRVAVGMNIHWPRHGEALTTYAPIASVDYLDLDRERGIAEVALGIRFEDDDEGLAKLFEELFEGGMIVDVADASSQDG
jgi:hypothetical protein